MKTLKTTAWCAVINIRGEKLYPWWIRSNRKKLKEDLKNNGWTNKDRVRIAKVEIKEVK